MTGSTDKRTPAQAEREKRQAAALRENLKRRKQQARDRAQAGETAERDKDDHGQR
jgi:hypothetical protein